jgi:hypothetical protein
MRSGNYRTVAVDGAANPRELRAASEEYAMLWLSRFVLRMALDYPEWTERLLARISDNPGIIRRNAETLKASFPEIDC